MVLCLGTLGRCLGHEDGAPRNEIHAFVEEALLSPCEVAAKKQNKKQNKTKLAF